MTPGNQAVRNERLKLAATYFNNLATAFAVSGFVAPLAQQQLDKVGTVLLGFTLLVVSGLFFAVGRAVLGGLTP